MVWKDGESRLPSRLQEALRGARSRMSATSSRWIRARDTMKEFVAPVWRRPYPRVGVGIVTYNRPEYFRQVVHAAFTHFSPIADLFVHNDGSSPNDEYRRIFASLPNTISIWESHENRGIAPSKNALLKAMKDYDYLFILEDDIIPLSPNAIIEYVKVSLRTGIEHFSFAHHGPANASGPVGASGWVEFYPNAIGAWCMYTRRAIETVGYLDENFHNAWEHVEHTHRLAKAGLTSPFWRFADVYGSQRWFREIPQAIESSTIRNNPSWRRYMREGLVYWSQKDPEHFPLRHILESLSRQEVA